MNPYGSGLAGGSESSFMDRLRRRGVPRPSGALLDALLPEFHARERHSISVAATPGRVFEAVRAVTLAEMPVVHLLVRLRGIGAAADRPLLAQMQRGLPPLAEEPDRELVLAGIGQPWKLRRGESPKADFREFAAPGFAKMALNFRFDRGVLSTETRVFLTDPGSRRRFRAYWLVIRPFSGFTRRRWLRAVKRRAESHASD
jgi:hypothetical protein